jgi:hypothetical protein
MAIESVKTRLAQVKLGDVNDRELRALLVAIVDGLQNIATKLDADATVTGTDYASTTAAIITD